MTTATAEINVKCPNRKCDSNKGKTPRHIWKKGYTPTNGGMHRQRFVCYVCGKTFFSPDIPCISLTEYLKRMGYVLTKQ